MKRCLIISTSFVEQKILEEAQSNQGPLHLGFETTASFGQEINWWLVSGPDVLVINLPDERDLLELFYDKTRESVPRAMPIIFVADGVDPELMKLAGEFDRTRIIKKPLTGPFLYRAICDLATDFGPHRQTKPRYLTDQVVHISMTGKRETCAARMKNVSLGGFYIETDMDPYFLQVNTAINVRIDLGPGKVHEFRARIVWMKKLAAERTMGFGCQFVDPAGELNNLLKDV